MLGMVREELTFGDAESAAALTNIAFRWINSLPQPQMVYTAGKWIAAQLNVLAVIGFVPLSPGSPTQCLNQLSYLPTQNLMEPDTAEA